VTVSRIDARALRGVPASPGIGVGSVRRLGAPASAGAVLAEEERGAEIERALGALAGAANELDALAARLRADGRDGDAEIVETGALMALDPGLAAGVEAAVGADGLPAADAILTACSAQADVLAALPDETLAARADDIRSLGRRAALLAAGPAPPSVDGRDVVLVADDLGPADIAELDAGVQAVALAGGSATAHAAIVARSLAIPLVAELGDAVLGLADGAVIVVDGGEGVVLAEPDAERVQHARTAATRRTRAREHAAEQRAVPAVTRDGRRVTVLANVAGAAEWRLALDAGAEGVGLLRTELAFLQAETWPTPPEHRRALEPVLHGLGGRPATVRVLDFGGDKLPPFLRGARERGIQLLLTSPKALAAQLRAILESAAGAEVRVLLPMLGSTGEIEAAATALRAAARAVGVPVPPLGPMIETPAAAGIADALARRADFLSIGTNDLTAATLGTDRFAPGAGAAHHPRVLAAIAASVNAARHAGVPIEVCGEAASDPIALPLLVGLGVDEVSVGASRVGTVRAWVRELVHREAEELATRALGCTTAPQVEALVAPTAKRLTALERGDTVSAGTLGELRAEPLTAG
jgi:phosphoenolpyruvate-protein kinase (PTS system EI component)